MKRAMQENGEAHFSIILVTITANFKSYFKILKNLFSITASPLPWKQSLLSLLSLVCVDLSNSSKTYDCLFGRTCKEFHFFSLSSNFFLHFLSSPFFTYFKVFAFTQEKSYIKVVVKSLLLKTRSPHSKYRFPLSIFQSSFAKQHVNFLFSLTQFVWFLF